MLGFWEKLFRIKIAPDHAENDSFVFYSKLFIKFFWFFLQAVKTGLQIALFLSSFSQDFYVSFFEAEGYEKHRIFHILWV